MSGLIMKDLELLRVNIKVYMAVFMIGILYLIVKKDGANFFVAYMIFVSIGLSVGTIAYDSYDHGMNFLMTLPVTRKQYVYEKYLMSTGVMIGAGIVSLLAGMLKVQLSGDGMPEDIWVSAIAALISAGILLAIMLPLRLKYEAEKSRIIIIAVVAGVCLIIFAGQKVLETVNVSMADGMRFLDSLSGAALTAAGIIVFVIAMLISAGCSLKIMKNKEF